MIIDLSDYFILNLKFVVLFFSMEVVNSLNVVEQLFLEEGIINLKLFTTNVFITQTAPTEMAKTVLTTLILNNIINEMQFITEVLKMYTDRALSC